MPNILIVDDDTEIRNLLSELLPRYGFNTRSAANTKALFTALDASVDLILLDIMLGDDDGIALCKQIREQSAVPIIMISAMSEPVDKVLGLEVGADDYIAKPFYPREVIARINTVLRRHQHKTESNLPQEYWQFSVGNASWRLYPENQSVFDAHQNKIALSHSEYLLLQKFLENSNRILTREQLLSLLHHFTDSDVFDRSIDVLICRLRKHIEANPKIPTLIKTIRGEGYLFTAKVEKYNAH